jgi:hypothetical protein
MIIQNWHSSKLIWSIIIAQCRVEIGRMNSETGILDMMIPLDKHTQQTLCLSRSPDCDRSVIIPIDHLISPQIRPITSQQYLQKSSQIPEILFSKRSRYLLEKFNQRSVNNEQSPIETAKKRPRIRWDQEMEKFDEGSD